MKVVHSAARGSRDQCKEHIKCTMTAWLHDMYRTINGQLTDITVRVMDKYRVKWKCNAWATDKSVPERVRQGSHVLLSPRRCTSSVRSHGPPLPIHYSLVSMRSLSVIVCWTCSQCPELFQLTRFMSGSSLATNQVHWTSTDANWTSTRQGTHKFWTKRMPAHNYLTSRGRLFPVESVPSFVHAQNFPPDWTDLTWQGAHSPKEKRTMSAFTEWGTDKKRMWMEKNGLKI